MIVKVLHVKDEEGPTGHSLLADIGWGECAIDFAKNHIQVAEVSVESDDLRALDEAYHLTQNIEWSWLTNKTVVPAAAVKARGGCRSTHIGDVLLVKDDAYVCVPIGWEKVLSPDQKIKRG